MKIFAALSVCLGLLEVAAAIAPDNEAARTPIGARSDGLNWQDWTAISVGQYNFAPGSFVSTFDGNQLFAIREDGIVCTATVDKNGVWSRWSEIATNYQMHPKTRISATWNPWARRVELYATAIDGYVWMTLQNPDLSWQPWDPISTATKMGDGAPVTIFWAHNNTVMELFAASENKNIVTCRREYSADFTEWQPIRPDTQVPPGAFITYRDDPSIEGARQLYVIDVNGQAKSCPWDTRTGRWKPCGIIHQTPMRPGALIAMQKYYGNGDLLVTTNGSGFAYSSDKLGGNDWLPVDSRLNAMPGAEIALYVQGKNEFLFVTNQYGKILFTARTRDENNTPDTPWFGWTIMKQLDNMVSGGAVNVFPDPNTREMRIYVAGADNNVWTNWYKTNSAR